MKEGSSCSVTRKYNNLIINRWSSSSATRRYNEFWTVGKSGRMDETIFVDLPFYWRESVREFGRIKLFIDSKV